MHINVIAINIVNDVCVITQAEEMVKREMLTMMHYDAAYNPTEAQQGLQAGKKQTSQKAIVTQAQHLAYLEHHTYEPVTQEELESVTVTAHLFCCSRSCPIIVCAQRRPKWHLIFRLISFLIVILWYWILLKSSLLLGPDTMGLRPERDFLFMKWQKQYSWGL